MRRSDGACQGAFLPWSAGRGTTEVSIETFARGSVEALSAQESIAAEGQEEAPLCLYRSQSAENRETRRREKEGNTLSLVSKTAMGNQNYLVLPKTGGQPGLRHPLFDETVLPTAKGGRTKTLISYLLQIKDHLLQDCRNITVAQSNIALCATLCAAPRN